MTEEIMEQTPVAEETVSPVETEDSGTSQQADTDTGQEELPGEEPRKPSKGVQKRIDELVREREEWKRAALQGQPRQDAPSKPVIPDTFPDLQKPIADNFETYDAYVEALADYRAETKYRQIQARTEIQRRQETLSTWFDAADDKYSDFRDVFSSAACSDTMADVLLASENGVDIAYYLGHNPAESRRIAKLPPGRQAFELGKLEAKLANQPPPQKNQTKAPPAMKTLGGKETPTKKPEDMSYDEYKAWRQAGGGR